jgi:hypothetical protein
MCRRISNWLYQVSNHWVALSALAIFLLFTAMALPRQSARAEAYTRGVGSPDLSLYYTADDLYHMAEEYGEQGREAYIRARFTFDALWPLVYSLFLGTAISWVHGRVFEAQSPWRLANLVPPLGAALDYLENVSTSLVMLRYPHRTAAVDSLAPFFTLAKWALISGSFLLLLAGVLTSIWRRKRRRGKQ